MFAGVRQRKRTKNVTEKKASEDVSGERTPDEHLVRKENHNPQQDPLKWFGILVPQPLRQAQSSFKQGMMLNNQLKIEKKNYKK